MDLQDLKPAIYQFSHTVSMHTTIDRGLIFPQKLKSFWQFVLCFSVVVYMLLRLANEKERKKICQIHTH
jgi:hypothetical protein